MMYNSWYAHSWGWGPLALGVGIIGITFGLILIAILVALKGLALWHAAKRNEKWWFVILLILNTLGILELIYLAFVVKWHRHPHIPSGGASGAN